MLKVDLNSLGQQFLKDAHVIGGEEVFLVQPKHLYLSWTPETLIFRSSVWNEDGAPVSLSFPKFFNWGEFTDVVAQPDSLDISDCQLVEKMDGSTLIVSQYKGQRIVRTRGTLDARTCDNGEEIELLIELFPKAFEFPVTDEEGTAPVSYLYEWITADPELQLVVQYKESPDLFLIGAVDHADYSLATQTELDQIAREKEIKRPPVYNYSSLEELLASVATFQGVEGICFYFNGGQNIAKLKSGWYLKLHRLKTGFQGLESVIDLYVELGFPTYEVAWQYLVENVDYETAEACRGYISTICDAMKEVRTIEEHMLTMAKTLNESEADMQEKAARIYESYGRTNRGEMVIGLLRGADALTRDQVKKLIYQVLK